MTNSEAVNWIINLSADIGKAEHRDLWHYEQALSEIREMLESAQPERRKGRWRKGICECGYDWAKDAPISSVPNFCPNCGADMRHERRTDDLQ